MKGFSSRLIEAAAALRGEGFDAKGEGNKPVCSEIGQPHLRPWRHSHVRICMVDVLYSGGKDGQCKEELVIDLFGTMHQSFFSRGVTCAGS